MKPTDLQRREVIRMAGALAAGSVLFPTLFTACGDDHSSMTTLPKSPAVPRIAGAPDYPPASSTCALTPEETEGPYYVDVNLMRQDISEGQPGLLFAIKLVLVNTNQGCTPITGKVIEIWHASPQGLYSDIASAGTTGKTYLRGSQVSAADGSVEFKTVYPGWYQGRAVHVHFKVHLGDSKILTSQFYFDDATTDQIFQRFAPYNTRQGTSGRLKNDQDSIVQRSGPTLQMPLNLVSDSSGVAGSLRIGVAIP